MDAIPRGNVTDVVYLDFQQAFDTVPHKRLTIISLPPLQIAIYLSTMGHRQPSPNFKKMEPSTEPALMVMFANIEGLSLTKQQIVVELCANHT